MHNTWVATSYGALDIGHLESAAEAGIDCMVLPTYPSEPIGLKDDIAALWRRLVAGPVPEDELTVDEVEQVRQFEEFGLASADRDHPARTTSLPRPWLNSPLHELVYSLAAHLARETDAGVVFIKGPALHRQGLRDREDSGDVDVWADPDHVDALGDRFTRWGWRVLSRPGATLSPSHSLTLRPDSWGCEIDVHFCFPGIDVPDRQAFALLRANAEPLTFAGTTVTVPRADAHAVIAALHSARPQPGVSGRPPVQAADALTRAGDGTIAIARSLRADAALAPAFALAFPGSFTAPAYDPPLNWRWRDQPSLVRSYLMAFRLAPIADRPRLLFRLFWPTATVAFASDAAAGGRARTALGARVRRLARGVRKATRKT